MNEMLYEPPEFLKPYIEILHKKNLHKCKECENLVVCKLGKSKVKPRGSGDCYHNPYNWPYHPRTRYFSDFACPEYIERTSPLELFKGGVNNEAKISLLYHRFIRERCFYCKDGLYYHDDKSIYCKCGKTRHNIEEVENEA